MMTDSPGAVNPCADDTPTTPHPIGPLPPMLQDALAQAEAEAKAVAQVIGPQSAARRALDSLERRRSQGESVYLFRVRGSWVVGPLPLPNGGAR